MGCLDKVGGTIIALLIIIVGFSESEACVIISGVIFEILILSLDADDCVSWLDSLDSSPFTMVMYKFLTVGIISGIVGFALHHFFNI